MVRLEESEILGRLIRKDDWADLGVSTVTKALEAIDSGRLSEAKELVKYLWAEGKGLHDLYADWSWAVYDYIAEKYGEEELFNALKTAHAVQMEQMAQLPQAIGPEGYAQISAEFMRAHRSGPNQLGDVTVRDEGDRIVIECDPCGSGGRMMRGDPVAGTPPRTEAPYNYGLVKGAHPWTWSKENVPRYCVHCWVSQIVSIEAVGFPGVVIESPENPGQPCRQYIYKDPRTIPEEYYTRVGKSKPKHSE